MKKLFTAQELAEMLNLSVETIWRYTRQKNPHDCTGRETIPL
ncbi:MAG: helix-turn-helix domain-containing protein [Desulfosporosinus sp.]|nr:helix-turn-helix domain-containing protein [Desulfosporosinus sp.]